MLNRTRNEVLNMLAHRLENDLDCISTECDDFTDMNDGEYYGPAHRDDRICKPPVAHGWPPEIQELIRRVAIATATTIVNAIYTEAELDGRVDEILLTDEDKQ